MICRRSCGGGAATAMLPGWRRCACMDRKIDMHTTLRLQEAELPDDLPNELRQRGRNGNAAGLPPLLARLQEAAERCEGAAEELAALFVALLRAAGCLTRLVR